MASGVPVAVFLSVEELARLGSVYVPTILALWLSMVAVISLYSLTREQHEQNLKDLKDRNESEANSLQS